MRTNVKSASRKHRRPYWVSNGCTFRLRSRFRLLHVTFSSTLFSFGFVSGQNVSQLYTVKTLYFSKMNSFCNSCICRSIVFILYFFEVMECRGSDWLLCLNNYFVHLQLKKTVMFTSFLFLIHSLSGLELGNQRVFMLRKCLILQKQFSKLCIFLWLSRFLSLVTVSLGSAVTFSQVLMQNQG